MTQKSNKLTQRFNEKLLKIASVLSLTESCGRARPAKSIHHALEKTNHPKPPITMKAQKSRFIITTATASLILTLT
jgi:hypothetical protein